MLILDHSNGDRWDNRLDNLRFVCGWCEGYLPTHNSHNKKVQKERQQQKLITEQERLVEEQKRLSSEQQRLAAEQQRLDDEKASDDPAK